MHVHDCFNIFGIEFFVIYLMICINIIPSLLQIINTYTEAVQTVEPKIASGKPHTLWVEFAKFYENAGQLEDARVIFEKAVQVPYRYVDDLAAIWCEWAEMELRHE